MNSYLMVKIMSASDQEGCIVSIPVKKPARVVWQLISHTISLNICIFVLQFELMDTMLANVKLD